MWNGLRLVIDFSEVENISSSIRGKLIKLKKKLTAARGRLRIEYVPPDLLEVFPMTRLDQMLGLEP